MSKTIQTITLAINAVDLLVVIIQLCLTWVRSARRDFKDETHRMEEIYPETRKYVSNTPRTWKLGFRLMKR
jgi:hypothetical protein